MKTQIKYQKEIEKLERENKELRKQILLKAGQKVAAKSIKKSLIDMYSEVGTPVFSGSPRPPGSPASPGHLDYLYHLYHLYYLDHLDHLDHLEHLHHLATWTT